MRFYSPILVLLLGLALPVFSSEPDTRQFSNWFGRGMSAVESDELEKAVPAFKKALSFSPGNPEALSALADCYDQMDEIDSARFYFEKAFTVAPDHFRTVTQFLTFLERNGPESTRISVYRAFYLINREDLLAGLQYLKALEEQETQDIPATYRLLLELAALPGAPIQIRKKIASLKASHLSLREPTADTSALSSGNKVLKDSLKADADFWVSRAGLLLSKNDTAQALPLFVKYAGFFKDDFDFNMRLGALMTAAARPDQAVRYYRIAVGIKPMDSTLILSVAERLVKQGKQKDAAWMWKDYGNVQKKFKNEKAAQYAYEKALAVFPECVEAMIPLSEIYLATGRLEDAEPLSKRALQLRPRLHSAHFLAARICIVQDRSGIAVDHLLKAIKEAPEKKEYSELLATVFFRSDEFEQVVNALEPVKNKMSPESRRIYAQSLKRLGRKESALEAINIADSDTPQGPDFTRQKAELLLQQNKPDAAISHILESSVSNEPAVRIVLARAYLSIGELDRAEDIIQKLSGLSGVGHEYAYVKGLLLYLQAKYSPAKAILREALAYEPDLPHVTFQLGMSQVRLGNSEDALYFFNILRKHRDIHWQSMGGTGQAAAFRLQKKPEAVEHHLKQAVEISPRPDAFYDLVRFYADAKDQKGLRVWADQLSAKSSGFWKPLAEAEALLAAGSLDRAEALAKESLAAWPNVCELHLMLARILIEKKAYVKAGEESRYAASRCPDLIEAYLVAGKAALGRNDKDVAKASFKAFLKRGGDKGLVP